MVSDAANSELRRPRILRHIARHFLGWYRRNTVLTAFSTVVKLTPIAEGQ
jgi:hypothetical protein